MLNRSQKMKNNFNKPTKTAGMLPERNIPAQVIRSSYFEQSNLPITNPDSAQV